MGSNDQTFQIVKGKRTKRPRSASPFGVAMTDSSSSGCGGGGGGAGGGERESVTDDYNSISSPTTSGEIYESTEEEEDMANCLIMLARGDASRHVKQEHKRDDDEDAKIEKLGTSRKFSTIVTSTNKAGFFVYECKTCNRSFPSFQALGGHRASHKKPKAAVEEKKSSLVAAVKEDFVQETGNQFNKISGSSPVSLQVSAAANNKGNKVHECSICGSEFTSGQALGGHMRRHRAAAAAVHVTAGNHHQVGAEISSVDTSTTNESKSASDDQHHHQVKPRSILPLDLNLPAPEDDHHQQLRSDSKFQFGSTQQALVFSAPTLVDCHY